MINHARKLVAGVLILLFCSLTTAVADVNTEVWTRLYNRTDSLQQKYAVMQSIVENHNREIIPVLQNALQELNLEVETVKGATEKSIQVSLMKLIVKELGNLKAVESAEDVYTTLSDAEDVFLKSEAIIALGNMRAIEYTDEIALILRNVNFFPSSDARRDEITAYACVLALGRLRQAEGYRPVFFASIGWYSPKSGVRDRAAEALDTMVDDPTPILSEIITTDSSYREKQAALEAGLRSAAPEEVKTVLATTALEEALRNVGKNITQKAELGKIRRTSMYALISFEAANPEAVPLLEQLLYTKYDMNEKLTAIQTLGVNGTDDAVRALSTYLKYHNERMASGINPADYRPVRATIEALGNTGNPLASEELIMVQYSGWANAVIREAKAALERLGS